MKLVKKPEHFEDTIQEDKVILESQDSVKDVIQNILDQLLLLEKCIDLNALNKLEKLNKLDYLEDLNYIKFIPNLRLELEELSGSFTELKKLEKLNDLEKLDQFKTDLEKLEATLEEMAPKFEKLGLLDRIEDVKELKQLDKLKELQQLKQLEKLDKLSELKEINQLEKLEQMKSLENLKYLESLNQLEHLDLLEKVDKLEALTKKSNFSLLDKLDKLEILKQERSKVWGGIIFKMIMDVSKNIIVAGALLFGFFYFAEQKEMIELTKSMLSLDAHTINISYNLLDKLSPLSKSKELQTSFYNKSMYEVVNYWNNETFNAHSRLLSLSFISDLNKDLIPQNLPHPLKEFEDIQIREMKDLDTLIKAMPEEKDKEMEIKAYFSQLFLAIHNGECKASMDQLKLTKGAQFNSLENKLRAQALYCLFKANKSSLTKTLKEI